MRQNELIRDPLTILGNSSQSLQGPACAADPAYAAWAVHEAPLVHCHEFNEPF